MRYFGNVSRDDLEKAGCDCSGQTVRYRGRSVGFLRKGKMCFWNGVDDGIISHIVPDGIEREHRSRKDMAMYYFGLDGGKDR